MSVRRGAVKVNPVTGKMEKYDPGAVPEGKHRDGCLLVDDRYVNAAKDIGLGSEKGASLAHSRTHTRAATTPPYPPPAAPTILHLFSTQACTATSER